MKEGDEFWNRTSPVLFPIVGRLKNDSYEVNNVTYKMSQHGFARDYNFEIINHAKDTATFLLESNSETLKIYPFDFHFYITYSLNGCDLTTTFLIENRSSGEMLYSVGGHPGFKIDHKNDYHIISNSNAIKYNLEGPYVSGHEKVENLDIIFDVENFANDAIILAQEECEIFILKNDEPYIKMTYDNMPLVGIWAPYKEEVDFVCLEPWSGIADYLEEPSRELVDKHYINSLEKDSNVTHSYTTSFLES
jgi:galactose mutarotase-like enzyme